jgi:glutaconate CoA-transferase subunit B
MIAPRANSVRLILSSIRSPGFVDGPEGRRTLGLPGGGPEMVITNLGCYGFSDGEMVFTSLHPGCTVEQVRENTGWDVSS